jgi:hypothetical protein
MKFSCFSLGTFCTMPKRPPLPEGTATRAEAAAIPEVSPKRVTNMRLQSQLKPVITSHLKIGVIDRAQVEALAMRGATHRSGAAPLTATGKRAARSAV